MIETGCTFKEILNESNDIKTQEINGYKEIKPKNNTDINTAKSFWDTKFSSGEKEYVEEAKEGGSYKEVKKYSDGNTHEVHHTPSDAASKLDRDDGPTIKMEKEDHRKTANWGSSIEAKQYQAEQREKIENGDFRGALQMDIDDIKEKFGNKYDKAISQMLAYVDKLEKEGKI